MSRFARTADLVAARQDARAAELTERVLAFVEPHGDERVLDAGTGAGALALALAPSVAEVTGVDVEPELLARARERAPANATFLEADATRLPFGDASFDLAGTVRTLHHVARPELVVAELARVVRPGGRVLVVDQLAPAEPEAAAAVDRFERARDPGHARLLPEAELHGLFAAHGLRPLRQRREVERRPLEAYLDLAGCAGEERARAEALAPHGPEAFVAEVGWYLLDRSG
ncbi:MAG TPA: methyltransferase domain-containing protein [Gaiellaceae bacterium]|nr:methyltransferase domain-containing protein [Gaiellaceae bacterium]